MCVVMKEDLYFEIIKKQQELINLMLRVGIADNRTIQVDNRLETDVNDMQEIVLSDDKQKNECDLDGFKKWLENKGRSDNCVDTYVRGVELFYRKYKVMNVVNLTEYEKEINSKFSPKTVNLRIAGMTSYFRYTGFTGYEFRRAKEQKRTFCNNAINEEQYNKLIDWAKDNSIKAWLIAKVIAGTGVRVSELIGLETKDLDRGYADIIGKGNKQRRIYFPNKLVEEIKDKCGKEYVVENRYGAQMTTRGVSQLLKNAGEKAGIPKEVMHPHSFRHFFAKQFLKEKNDISLLGDLLGHSDISTTAIYTRLTSEEQKEQINKLVNW